MKQILKDYIAIYQTEAIGKVQKKKQYLMAIEWFGREYTDIPNIQELLAFLAENEGVKFTKQFYDRLLFPQIRLSNDEYDADALLIVFQKDAVNYYQEFLNYQVPINELENIVLAKYNNNKDILEHRYKRQMSWFEYSIHEVPWGVLCGVNGATIADIREMKKDLVEFSKLSIMLNIDNQDKVCSILDIYNDYEQYLVNRNQYLNFQQYIEMRSNRY